MISNTVHVCLLRRFLLPVELRIYTDMYLHAKLTNDTIFHAVVSYLDPIYSQETKSQMCCLYGMIEWWDTSIVTDMKQLFRVVSNTFNRDISNWDVSNVTNMEKMFQNAFYFNQPIGKWNVSKVTNMSGMFWGASQFNQSLTNWNVSNVEDMSAMFCLTNRYNQPLSSWKISDTCNRECMFLEAYSFNQSIHSWKVPKNRSTLTGLLLHARNFNQPLNDSWKDVAHYLYIYDKEKEDTRIFS